MCEDCVYFLFIFFLLYNNKITSLCSDGGTGKLCVWIRLILLSLSECSSLRRSYSKDKGLRLFMAKTVYRLYLVENSKSLEGRGSLFFKKANSFKKKKKERKMKINRAGNQSGNGQSLWHRWEPVWVQVMQDGGELKLRSSAALLS